LFFVSIGRIPTASTSKKTGIGWKGPPSLAGGDVGNVKAELKNDECLRTGRRKELNPPLGTFLLWYDKTPPRVDFFTPTRQTTESAMRALLMRLSRVCSGQETPATIWPAAH